MYDLFNKYPQIDLDEKEKEDVINYIKNMNKINQEKNNNKPSKISLVLYYLF